MPCRKKRSDALGPSLNSPACGSCCQRLFESSHQDSGSRKCDSGISRLCGQTSISGALGTVPSGGTNRLGRILPHISDNRCRSRHPDACGFSTECKTGVGADEPILRLARPVSPVPVVSSAKAPQPEPLSQPLRLGQSAMFARPDDLARLAENGRKTRIGGICQYRRCESVA